MIKFFKPSQLVALFVLTGLFSIAGNKDQKPKATSISFTENKGQVSDQNYKPRPDILFSGTDGQMVFHLKTAGISYQLTRVDRWKEEGNAQNEKSKRLSPHKALLPDQSTIFRLDLDWLNTNKNFSINYDRTLEGHSNYYLEVCPNGINNVKSYTGVTYKNIYKNIDLHYYEKEGTLKYDYIVAPHANYKQIELQVKGADNIVVQESGSVIFKTPIGEIAEGKPLVYQEGKLLKSRWILKSNVLSFEIENYNPALEMIIDPVVRVWGTYYGGSSTDNGYSCSTDASGNIYMGGWTINSSGTLIATSGSNQTTIGGNSDAYLVKFNSTGLRQWGTYYGGSGYDLGYACTVDGSGNVFLAGSSDTNLGTAVATSTAQQPASGGIEDAFLVKFNSSGVRQWGTYYGGSGNDHAFSCATDASGNVFIAGETNSATNTLVATPGSHQATFGGSFDAFLAKYNSSGVMQWATYYGGIDGDYGQGCAVDPSGNIYLTGYLGSNNSTIVATAGAHQFTYGGGGNYDAFLVKFNTSGIRQWGTYYGGTVDDLGYSCTTDLLGNVYMTGTSITNTGTIIATSAGHQPSNNGGSDAFLVKFDASGVRQWGTYYGGVGFDIAYSSATDAAGNIYISGATNSNAGTVIATPGSHQANYAGNNDAFLTMFNSSGTRQWGTYYGDTGDDYGRDCLADQSGNIYMAGITNSGSVSTIATAGSHQSSITGGIESFLVRFIDCNAPPAPDNVTPPAKQTLCSSKTTTLNSTLTGTISWFTSATGGSALSSGTAFITPTLSTGTYTYYSEALVCSNSASRTAITVTVIQSPSVTATSGTICSGNSIIITPSGANSYTITGNTFTVSPSTSSFYLVTGTGTNGCISSNTAISIVIVNITPTVSVGNYSVCPGNSINIVPGGTDNYTISGNNFTVSPLNTTSYSVTGSSSLGCISANTATSIVTVYLSPSISVNGGSICVGNSFVIVPTGASTYSYSGGSATVSPGATNSYSITGASSVGCAASNTAVSTVSVSPLPTLSVNSGSICSGNSFVIVPTGASTYTFSGGSATVSPNTTSSYSITGASSVGCISAGAVVSIVSVSPSPTLSVNSGSICSGNSFVIVPTGASTYSYSGGSSTVSPGTTSSYSITGSSSVGCISTNTVVSTVTVFSLPNLTVQTTKTLNCVGESVTITATGALSYTFHPSAVISTVVISPTTTVTFSVSGTDANGCMNTSVFTQSVDACTGFSEFNVGNHKLLVYPNPNLGEFVIEVSEPMPVIVSNALGQIILLENLMQGKNKIDLKEFSNGIYFIQTQFGTTKILKE